MLKEAADSFKGDRRSNVIVSISDRLPSFGSWKKFSNETAGLGAVLFCSHLGQE